MTAGKNKVQLKKALVDKAKGEFQLEVRMKPLRTPTPIRLLDSKGDPVWMAGYSAWGGNDEQFISSEFLLEKIQGDPMACQLSIEVPDETAEYLLKATLEKVQLPE